MLLIPAIDLKDGHCVRLEQGDMDKATVFSEDPAAMAKHWISKGSQTSATVNNLLITHKVIEGKKQAKSTLSKKRTEKINKKKEVVATPKPVAETPAAELTPAQE